MLDPLTRPTKDDSLDTLRARAQTLTDGARRHAEAICCKFAEETAYQKERFTQDYATRHAHAYARLLREAKDAPSSFWDRLLGHPKIDKTALSQDAAQMVRAAHERRLAFLEDLERRALRDHIDLECLRRTYQRDTVEGPTPSWARALTPSHPSRSPSR